MAKSHHGVRIVLAAVMTLAIGGSAVAQQKTFRYTVGPGASISLTNQFGPVTVRPSSNGQVTVTGTLHSNKVEVDAEQHGNRVQVQSHFLQRADANEGRVDYDLQIPADATLFVRSASGPISVQGLTGDVNVEGDAAQVAISDLNGAHLHVRTLNGPITLTNVANGFVDVSSVSGSINLNNISGQRVTATTTSGKISSSGGVNTAGIYSLSTHNGDIDVALPSSTPVEITARSINGSVQNDFPLQPMAHTALSLAQGKSLAGTTVMGTDSGSASLRLRSFSGKIQVRKQ